MIGMTFVSVEHGGMPHLASLLPFPFTMEFFMVQGLWKCGMSIYPLLFVWLRKKSGK